MWFRGGRGAASWMVPVRCCLVAEVDRRLGPKKPFPQTQTLERVIGGRGERGPGFRMYQSCVEVASLVARSSREVSRCEATRGERSRRRRRVEKPQRGVRNTTRGGLGPTRVSRCQKHRGASSPGTDAQSPVERPEEEQRISCRGKASWTGKSFVASRRRGGSGLGGFQLNRKSAHRENAQRRYRMGFATGASEARSRAHVGQKYLADGRTGLHGAHATR